MNFVANKQYLRKVLLFCFNLYKNGIKSLLEETYGKYAAPKLSVKINLKV